MSAIPRGGHVRLPPLSVREVRGPHVTVYPSSVPFSRVDAPHSTYPLVSGRVLVLEWFYMGWFYLLKVYIFWILKVYLLKLGTGNQDRAQDRGSRRSAPRSASALGRSDARKERRPGGAAAARWEVWGKEALGTGAGVPRTNCRRPPLPCCTPRGPSCSGDAHLGGRTGGRERGWPAPLEGACAYVFSVIRSIPLSMFLAFRKLK